MGQDAANAMADGRLRQLHQLRQGYQRSHGGYCRVACRIAHGGGFPFLVGNDGNPGGWDSAPAPLSITVRRRGHQRRRPRDDHLARRRIENQWLQVMVRATENTGLAADDVFYFGNAVGESGNAAGNAIVNATDEIMARNFQHGAIESGGDRRPIRLQPRRAGQRDGSDHRPEQSDQPADDAAADHGAAGRGRYEASSR